MRRITSALFASILVVSACGGSDGDSAESVDGGDGPALSDDDGSVAMVPLSGEVQVMSGDGLLAFTLTAPAGLQLTEFSTEINPTFENPDLDFGERNLRVSVIATPVGSTADDLITSFQTVNSTITVLEQADEDGFSWFTYTTPSSSDENEIAFASAKSALTLADGTSLECTAATQRGIDETWSTDDAAAVAAQMLDICRSLDAV